MTIEETTDLAACHALRRTVFIEEQAVPEADEMDDQDAHAIHLLARDDGRPVATARLLIKDDIGKIGRVCVLASHRGTGLGATLMRAALDALAARGVRQARLGSQTHAMGFYEKLGFVAEGPVYDDAGIPHRDMALNLK
ncbi:MULTISPECIES: GNAT family N-acetyltransferase [Paracoccus]|uniref:GNAT family N-acetyltransferase n=1 Tax=Paracoccus hibiscisoli TaxID=2023261 RepID=A0A4U0QWH8_9RHOB|nr:MULTISPECIES: GNAT family N-acetyltransferase [Paracoccus]ODT59708.1 MAG: drug:proton antiporter [Paracoccus sp. SCN 68-21]TJZ86583.1 GNAT family N-acetyltransferase [Paracoccus hibiscisoli]